MKCTVIPGFGVVCGGRARRVNCSVPGCTNEATRACDAIVGRRRDGVAKTCEAKLCERCTKRRPGSDDDLCGPHDKLRVTVAG